MAQLAGLFDMLIHVVSEMSATSLVAWEHDASELSNDPFRRVRQLYDLEIESTGDVDSGGVSQPTTPLSSSFQLLMKLSLECASNLLGPNGSKDELLTCLGSILSLLDSLVLRSAKSTQKPPSIFLDSDSWLDALLSCVTDDLPFEVLDILLKLLMTLSGSTFLHPPVLIDQRSVIKILLSQVMFVGHTNTLRFSDPHWEVILIPQAESSSVSCSKCPLDLDSRSPNPEFARGVPHRSQTYCCEREPRSQRIR